MTIPPPPPPKAEPAVERRGSGFPPLALAFVPLLTLLLALALTR